MEIFNLPQSVIEAARKNNGVRLGHAAPETAEFIVMFRMVPSENEQPYPRARLKKFPPAAFTFRSSASAQMFKNFLHHCIGVNDFPEGYVVGDIGFTTGRLFDRRALEAN